MAAELFVNLDEIDLTHELWDVNAIEAVNPHRGHMRMLDGILYTKVVEGERCYAVGYKDIGHDEFWVDGHIPGRPLFPGVLMVEASAQLASFMLNRKNANKKFIGFTGTENVKFRGQVVPGDRLYIVGHEWKFTPRRMISDMQGVVNGKLVFESRVIGMPI